MAKFLTCVAFLFAGIMLSNAQETSVWKIGTKDHSTAELALGPSDYKKFLEKDFGYEDQYYLIGKSDPKNDFPYVIPGPDDTWGGTWSTSGWRTHEVNILFGISDMKDNTQFKLIVDLMDSSPTRSILKIIVNDSQSEKYTLKGEFKESLTGESKGAKGQTIEIPLKKDVLRKGGNKVTITVLEGSWVLFDALRLDAIGGTVKLEQPDKVFIRDIQAAKYEILNDNKRFQPLVVDVEHLKGRPEMSVELDGKVIFKAKIDTTRYQFEVPMPAVSTSKKSTYNVLIDGVSISKGQVQRAPQKLQTYADYVDTELGTAHSRWMIAPGPWMPFSMVKMSPDNQNKGWQAGYQPTFETVGCFSHIHEWTMGGLGLMPTNGTLQTKVGDQFKPDEGYRSRIDKLTEEAPLGHYKVYMTDTKIWAEVTATTRCGFQKYTFPKDQDGRVMIDLHVEAEYDYNLVDIKINKVSDYRIEGYSHQISPRPNVWSNDADQEYTVHFVIEFDQPIKKIGGWINKDVIEGNSISGKNIKDAGAYVEFDTKKANIVQVRTGISLVSIENASENLKTEITKPFNWNYQAVVENQKTVWNEIFSRVSITTNDKAEKLRFYTNMYRALCRNTWSDVNGEWISAGGKKQKFTNPDHIALGCDAFWNTFWNLNQFWNLITPEWSSRWVNSQLGMYDADGWLAKGPAGMKYIPVMVAEHEIPLMVSAYQMGIRDFDTNKALEAMVKMQTTPAAPVATGFAGNRDLKTYMRYKYVPSDSGRFSNTLEYSYDDWTVGQFAKALGKKKEYEIFSDRGNWWKNAINKETGYAHMRKSNGEFVEKFDPFRSGANQQYVEGNAWQLSYFVPQDVPGLIDILGEKAFVDRLDWGFTASEPWRYNAPNDQYWDYPVVQGNQQSMHFAFLFNWANHPWLTQRWSRSIIDGYYGYGIANAYLGDEDQGQMSAWLVMASLGLFQTDGGCNATPIYEIASPLYEKVVIDLGKKYGRGGKFTISANGASKTNKYVQSATLNGKELKTFWFPASELLKGGELILQMGDQPNKLWGVQSDNKFNQVSKKAEMLISTGLNAGDGYAEVWIRDLNTFIEAACKVSDTGKIREALLTFFKFQGKDGNIVDGYVPRNKNQVPYDFIFSDLAPEFAAHKNTVETDQESSLIQSIYKYIQSTKDYSFLKENIAGKTVETRMKDAFRFLLKERYNKQYGLLWGATTSDWGDVQPEHSWGVRLDSLSHKSIDIYDNAMFIIAIQNYIELINSESDKKEWKEVADRISRNTRTHLWDSKRQKFIPHIYLKGSPFPADFDENAIYYHGGTAVAIEAGLLSKDEILVSYNKMKENMVAAKAQTIGLTIYPVYPNGFFKNQGMYEYGYQNGGDWTWFGGRMVQQLIRNGYIEEAKEAISPMLDRVVKNNGFYEWYTPQGEPKGSGEFRGSAGVLWKAIQLFNQNTIIAN